MRSRIRLALLFVAIIAALFGLFFAAVRSTVVSAASGDLPDPGERRTNFDRGWRFSKGDSAGAAQPGFADTTWRALDLPHDWAIEGPFDPSISPHQGSLPFFGVAWYRKHFTVPAAAKGRYYSVQFDGVMANSTVYLNGHELGSRPYGYISFEYDLTPHLVFGGENVLAVRVAPEPESSRWYPGAGIYRHVWIDATGPVHVAHWGTYVTTPQVGDAAATVSIRTALQNRNQEPARVTLETSILDANGKEVSRASSEHVVAPGEPQPVTAELTVERPQRWDLDRPYLYTASSTVRRGREVTDRYTTPFGIRTIEYGPAKGFLLNGRRVRFQGVCDHHDLGALGTAINRRALERQLEILRKMGTNAIRTSHNPPAPELLELTDRMGFLVMDEAFDMWSKPKVPNGHGKYFDRWGERDLRDMLRRDRNHPSVVLWSIGNEVSEQSDPDGWKLARRLTQIAHEEDATRPVTSAFNQVDNAIKNRLADEVDIPGFNYGVREYARILKEHPNWTIVGSETASCLSSRGVYHLPVEAYEKHPSHQISSYDIIVPRWGYPPDVEFAGLEQSPAVLGEFVWTGFDYLGEPIPYWAWYKPRDPADWPVRSSYFGIIDLAGFPKDRYYLYQSQWTKQPMVHLLPHWNWPGHEGKPVTVMAYTNAEDVELFLNGRSLGRKHKGEPYVLPVTERVTKERQFTTKNRLVWEAPYAPGELKAIAYSGGRSVAEDSVRTAGPAVRVVLSPDRAQIQADGEDLSFITVRIEDDKGTLVPVADNLVRFEVSGPGRIAAVDNGNPATTESFQADRRKAFNGLALLILRSNRDERGSVRVRALSDGLLSGETLIRTQ
jgi:beta-galactosidase